MSRIARRRPTDEELFALMKHLQLPTDLKSLSIKTGKPDSTLSRWLNDYLGPVLERDGRVFWLKGYSKGEPNPAVVIPAGQLSESGTLAVPDDKWRRLYLRLGVWEYQAYDNATNSFILRRTEAYSQPDEEPIPSGFRPYREYAFLTGSVFLLGTPEAECTKFFADVCRGCLNQPYRAPWLKSLCPQCKQIGSYELVRGQLQSLGIQPKKSHVLLYLSYEYRKELMIMMERSLREDFEKGDLARFYRRRDALRNRYLDLRGALFTSRTYDMSVENKLGKALFQLVTVPQVDAEEAIRIALDLSRWHQMDEVPGGGIEVAFLQHAEEAEIKYEAVARPIIDKALFAKLP